MGVKAKEVKLDRNQQLVRAAKARAAITGYLTNLGTTATPDVIMQAVGDLDFTTSELGSLLYRMANDGLISKKEVEHPDYRFGYSCSTAMAEPTPMAQIDRKKEPKEKAVRKHKKADYELPLDLIANRDGSITLRFAGLRLTVSREI